MEKLFKDRLTSKKERHEKIKQLLKVLKIEEKQKRDAELKKLLFSTETPERYHGAYKLGEHLKEPCKGFREPEDNARVTEKRIFHCLAYRSADKSDCSGCLLQKQGEAVRLAEGSRMVDFEVPAYYCGNGNGVGEIDLVIEQGGVLYAVEVKSPTSSERVLRMVAEILTYTLGSEEYQPAIGFFGGSEQEREYHELMKDNEDFRELLDEAGITVFQMEKTGEQLTITALPR